MKSNLIENTAVISANLGSDQVSPRSHATQKVYTDLFNFTDENFPPRHLTLMPRLQAKIPKMYGPELVPDYDFYVWIDSTITLVSENTIQWLRDGLGTADMVFFAHHDGRTSIVQELKFMQGYTWDNYLKDRYANEPLDKQVEFYLADTTFVDNHLFSGGTFMYRNIPSVRSLLSDWFCHCARWSVQDQLSLPYVMSKHPEVTVRQMKENLLDNSYISHSFNAKSIEERPMSNANKWDEFYKNVPAAPSAFVYGDTHTYKLGADDLSNCSSVEDWGTGGGGFKRFRINAIGVDGSNTPHADKIADLETYTSQVEGIFMRHVLEHNHGWVSILKNALQSFTKKMILVVFTPLTEGDTFELTEGTAKNRSYGIDVPNLSLSIITILHLIHFHNCKADIQKYATDTEYGEETVFLISKR